MVVLRTVVARSPIVQHLAAADTGGEWRACVTKRLRASGVSFTIFLFNCLIK
jgi:hypothetical protein